MSHISPKWRRLWGIRPDALRQVDVRFRRSGPHGRGWATRVRQKLTRVR